jgi:chromosome partitioning protein
MKILSIGNNKGGSAKTTTAVNLAVGLALKGKQTLLIDLDSQADATSVLAPHDAFPRLICDVLKDQKGVHPLATAIVSTSVPNLALLPSHDEEVKSLEIDISSYLQRELLLAKRKPELERLGYDYVVIDLPATSPLIKLISFFISDVVIVPLTPTKFARNGLDSIARDVNLVTEQTGHPIAIRVLLCQVDDRTIGTKRMRQHLHEEELTTFQFQTEIPLNIEVEYAHQNEQSVLTFAPKSLGAAAYFTLTKEVIQL